MSNTLNMLWEKCLLLIKENVSEQNFQTWFRPITFESFNESERILLLQVPSNFFVEYLEQVHVNLLRKVLVKCFGNGIKLRYRILVDKQNNLTQEVEAEPVADIGRSNYKTENVNKSPTVLDAAVPQEIDSQLNPKQTFENYIEGVSNRMTRAVSMAIANEPDKNQFNPLFVYGPSGCGKTHLINAIGVRIKELRPSKRVLYVSAKLFQTQYYYAVKSNSTTDFINFYQTIDTLIVDDIQEWISSEKTQNTFFHIFNHLFRNGKHIILACDRPPVDLKGMNERLLTRFSCGLIAELERPDYKLCVDILNTHIKRNGLNIPENVVEFIAGTANGSVRDLEGVVNSLLAFSMVDDCRIDLRLAERVVKRAVKVDNEPLTLDDIVEVVCNHFNISAVALSGKSRQQIYALPRQVVMYLARKYTQIPAARIGKLIGGRDHSTVVYSCTKVENLLKTDKSFSDDIQSIENSFKLKR